MYTQKNSNFATKNSKTNRGPKSILKVKTGGSQWTQKGIKPEDVDVISKRGQDPTKTLSIEKIIQDLLPKSKASPLLLLIKQFAKKKRVDAKFILQ